MKELRTQHRGEPYRTFFAFDPRRCAILLIGGNKGGDDRFYQTYIPLADRSTWTNSRGRGSSMAKKWSDLKRRMSPEAKARVDARVKATLASMPLAELRKAIGMTQADLASKLDQGQGSVSKIEHAADMYLTTLRKYVEALGGELHLTATFPDGRSFEIDQVSDVLAG